MSYYYCAQRQTEKICLNCVKTCSICHSSAKYCESASLVWSILWYNQNLTFTKIKNSYCINPYDAKIFFYEPWRQKGFFNLKSPYMFWLALTAAFKYLCYGSIGAL